MLLARTLRSSLCTALFAVAATTGCRAAGPAQPLPRPALDAALAARPGKATAIFAGGCFWGTQSVFQRVKASSPPPQAMTAAPPTPPPTPRSPRKHQPR